MQVQQKVSLKSLNTFGIDARADYYVAPRNEHELLEVLEWNKTQSLPVFVLGGGSNIILVGDYSGLVIHPAFTGITLIEESDSDVLIEVGAGEVWHDFVQTTLANGWFGLENLSLIPGTVGAAPVQNIGAYGVELADYLDSLTTIKMATQESVHFSREDCRLAYRDSIFKQSEVGQHVITRVRFRLLKQPVLKLNYGDIRQELQSQHIEHPTATDVAKAVIAIRQRKLPDPKEIGNAGSFFKNPVVASATYKAIKQQFPNVVAYLQGDYVKLAAGWLIEQAGWKGRQLGCVGSYEKQALVLVNHGGATGAEVIAIAQAIQQSVQEKFAVLLEMEPVVVGA
jgi:UDP-N-acetylmuramate dehydrogenase